MKVLKALALTLTIALFLAGLLFAQEKGQKEQTICPVMKGRKINKNLYVDHQGKRVYFCCQSCVSVFKNNPDKYMKQLEKEGVTLESAQKLQSICPITGEKIDKKYYVDALGFRIYASSEEAVKKIEENPEEAIKKIKENGEIPEAIPVKSSHSH